jgi:hypothetical protein
VDGEKERERERTYRSHNTFSLTKAFWVSKKSLQRGESLSLSTMPIPPLAGKSKLLQAMCMQRKEITYAGG